MNEEQPQVNTDAQRRALDVMSAQLLDNLNTMIAEQEARVQEFSRQQNSLSPLPAPESAPMVQPQASQPPAPSEQVWHPTPEAKKNQPERRTVTPPPIHAQKKKAPEQQYRIPRPSLNRPIPTDKEDEKENSVGCGKIAVFIVIIIILLRACS